MPHYPRIGPIVYHCDRISIAGRPREHVIPMINLLPPKEKEHLLLGKYKKLIILIFLILVLASVKFYILSQAVYQKEVLAGLENKYQTPDFLFFKDMIQKYNLSLKTADIFYKKQAYVSGALQTISEIERPAGLYLTSIAIDRPDQDNKATVTVFGVSDTRDSLILFKSNVEQNSRVKNIYFPPNNWIKSTGVNFYMTFEILYGN